MFGIKEREKIPCKTCEKPTPMLGTKLCDPCWEVETRLSGYLNNEKAIQFVLKALDKAQPEPQHDREPEAENQANTKPCPYNKAIPCVQYPDDSCGCDPCGECEIKSRTPKPLAQYLAGYLSGYLNGETLPRDLLEQALEAYENTQNVMIQIIKKKER